MTKRKLEKNSKKKIKFQNNFSVSSKLFIIAIVLPTFSIIVFIVRTVVIYVE